MATSASLDELAADLASDCWLPALDTETEFRKELEVDGIPGQVRVISFAVRRADGSESAWVVDLRDIDVEALARVLAPLGVVGWNANFDERALAGTHGLAVASWYDAMLADSVLRAGRHDVFWYRGLAAVGAQVLGVDVEGKGGVQLSYDLTSDLTPDQVAYAAQDAVVTRRVADWVRSQVSAAGLDLAVELENGARPFINEMMVRGVPFDLDGYLAEQIGAKEAEVADCLERLAAMTETKVPDPVTQMDLFADLDDEPEVDLRPVPSWNPNSKPDLIMALNRWSTAEVLAHTGGRLLTPADSLRKNDLKQIGGDLVKVLLKLKAAAKEVSTYGAELSKYTRDRRFFSRYKQALVATGRLASFSFNAQNMSKAMLSWMYAPEGRVLVYGDAGQAELRVVAHLSGDADMLSAFSSGEDFHAATARSMFPTADGEVIDAAEAKKRRTAAKAVNFGLVYGMAAGLLSTNLTVAGQPTTREEAQGYLDAYFAARPTMAEWLGQRDAFVNRVAANLPAIDWPSTLKLYRLRLATEAPRKAWKRTHGSLPTMVELAASVWPAGEAVTASGDGSSGDAASDADALAEFHARRADELAWAWSFEGAVVLDVNGAPVGYFSTTASGRRRYFDVPMGNQGNDKFSGVVTTALLDMCGTRKPAGRAYVSEFAAAHDLELPGPDVWRTERLRARTLTVKAFEGAAGKQLRWDFLTGAIERFGFDAMRPLLDRAVVDCLRSTRNAYRNHPVQGTVADIMESAFAHIYQSLPAGAFPVLSVHDSVVVECDAGDADAVALLVRDAIEGSMRRFCPSVVPSADVDVRTSLDDSSVMRVVDGDRVVAAPAD
jgi:DNA polymerase I-like protein with 3'-5' exonuclease and polymerase domains